MRPHPAVFVVLLAGCLQNSLVPCGDRLCPSEAVCIANRCASHADVDACIGKVDNDPCTSQPNAFCRDGVCATAVCGDSIVTPDETCDDGNLIGDDGCSAECSSNETCGNHIVDYVTGEQCDSGVIGLADDGCTSLCLAEFDTWREVTPQPIGVRFSHAMAWDVVHAQAVTFGGSSTQGTMEDTWQVDGTNWVKRVPVQAPTARSAYAMATSPVGAGTVMFGGLTTSGATNETWLWDGTTWNLRSPGAGPSPRADAAMALDSTRNRIILFGGTTTPYTATGETWAFDGSSWTNLAPVTAPASRAHHAMAYDPVRDRMVMFGGDGGSGETWEFDGTTWAPMAPAHSPPGRRGHILVYDVARARTVLFGGVQVVGGIADTWEWDGTDWTQITVSTPPAGRHDMAATYDPLRSTIVMQGGHSVGYNDSITYFSDTWEYTSAAQWTLLATSSSPPPRERAAFAYDSRRGRVVLWGGVQQTGETIQYFPQTWEWDGTSWSQQPAWGAPTADLVATYDAARGQVVAFSIYGLHLYNGGPSWIQPAYAQPSPSSRWGAALAYDAARERVVLFGGSVGGGETWEWDGSSWTHPMPATSPSARTFAQMAYDAHRKVVVLYGGRGLGDTWEWDGVNWTERTTPDSPPPRDDASLVYEPNRQRVMLFGGRIGNLYLSDTWEWDGEHWTQRTPVLSPDRRYYSLAAYDEVHGQVVMYGGRQVINVGDTWVYDFESAVNPRDRCESAASDSDGDALFGCADPDCWGRCAPLCPPGETCAATTPRCGDGTCDPVEDYLLCPTDCTTP